jgi:hypothetical protein
MNKTELYSKMVYQMFLRAFTKEGTFKAKTFCYLKEYPMAEYPHTDILLRIKIYQARKGLTK